MQRQRERHVLLKRLAVDVGRVVRAVERGASGVRKANSDKRVRFTRSRPLPLRGGEELASVGKRTATSEPTPPPFPFVS